MLFYVDQSILCLSHTRTRSSRPFCLTLWWTYLLTSINPFPFSHPNNSNVVLRRSRINVSWAYGGHSTHTSWPDSYRPSLYAQYFPPETAVVMAETINFRKSDHIAQYFVKFIYELNSTRFDLADVKKQTVHSEKILHRFLMFYTNNMCGSCSNVTGSLWLIS
jgi:hypothetical protein